MKSRIAAYSLMILLLAAHFSRAGNPILMVLVLVFPFLFLIKKAWVIQVLQVVSYASAIIWVFSAYQYIVIRISNGQDWLRLMIILFVVALYSALTGYLLNSDKVKEIYGVMGENEEEPETE